MLRKVTLCAALLLWASAQADKTFGNDVFDEILEELKDDDDVKLMHLEDFSLGFRRDSGIFHVYGNASLTDGYVTGLDTGHRVGDASVTELDDGSKVFKCTLGMGVLELKYKGTVTFMGLGPSVTMTSHTGYVTVDAEIVKSKDNGVKVKEFKIKEFEKFDVIFTGLGPLTWAYSLLVAPVVRLLTPIIRRVIEVGVRRIIESKLPAIFEHIGVYY